MLKVKNCENYTVKGVDCKNQRTQSGLSQDSVSISSCEATDVS